MGKKRPNARRRPAADRIVGVAATDMRGRAASAALDTSAMVARDLAVGAGDVGVARRGRDGTGGVVAPSADRGYALARWLVLGRPRGCIRMDDECECIGEDSAERLGDDILGLGQEWSPTTGRAVNATSVLTGSPPEIATRNVGARRAGAGGSKQPRGGDSGPRPDSR
jgi:hypothetical protein